MNRALFNTATKSQRLSRRVLWGMVWVLAVCAMTERAEAVTFTGLGDLADGAFFSEAFAVSADGSVVVGRGSSLPGAEAFRWTSGGGMVGLGDLAGGGFSSEAFAVSADGSVVVGFGDSASGIEAFRWTSGGGMVGLGDLAGGSFDSVVNAVSADGSVVVGNGDSASGTEAFRWTSGGGMVGLGDLAGGSFGSVAFAVSADGSVVVGRGNSALGFEAFRWTSSGGMVGLGDLAGGSFLSAATAVSADGSVVVGQGVSASGAEAFRWTSGGGMVGLGDLAGGSFFSVALAVSANGSVVVGQGTTASEVEAFVWDATGGMQSLTDVLSPSVGAALDGWTLSVANAISADGRTVVGQGTNPNGDTEAWLAYLADETHWFAETSGAWDSVLSWSGPFVPGPADDVVIDPTAALTVTGPGTSRTVNSLTLGGSGVGRVSLELASSGDLNVATYLYNETNGDLVLADGAIVSAQVLYNSGLVRGSGTVNADLVNYADAETRVASGESLVVSGLSHSNAGRLEVIDGSLELIGAVINDASTGLITGRDATLRFNHGVTNDGAIALSFGTSDVFGDIDNTATGEVVISGGAAVTFYDDVVQNGTLRVSSVGSTTSVAVFLGDFTGAGGTTGGGDIFFEGDLRPGNSPATVTLDNNVALGSGASLQIELGGLNPGSEYDQFFVTGDLSLDGLLEVSILPGFTPAAGQSFDILDWGSLSGTFAAINLPTLAGLSWNTSQLYMTGVLSVAAAGLLGDYNGNGTIDAADYTVWRDALTAGATSLLNDSTPGTVEESDFLYWRTHFGESLGSGAGGVSAAAAVPEPNTLVLLVLGGLLGLAARRHGRR